MKIKINNRQQLLAGIAIAVVGLFLADKVIFTPLTRFWQTRSRQLEELRVKVDDGRQLLQNEQRLRVLWAEMRTNSLPVEGSLAEQQLLQGFDRWRSESRAAISELTPQWKQDGDQYKTLELRADVAGDMRSVSRFLYTLERDPMALKVQAIEMNSPDNNGQLIRLRLQVSGLVLIPPAQQQPKR